MLVNVSGSVLLNVDELILHSYSDDCLVESVNDCQLEWT